MRRLTVPFTAAALATLWGIALAYIWLPQRGDVQHAIQLDCAAAVALTSLAGSAWIRRGKAREAAERVARDRTVRRLSDALVDSERVVASQRRALAASSRVALAKTIPLMRIVP